MHLGNSKRCMSIASATSEMSGWYLSLSFLHTLNVFAIFSSVGDTVLIESKLNPRNVNFCFGIITDFKGRK